MKEEIKLPLSKRITLEEIRKKVDNDEMYTDKEILDNFLKHYIYEHMSLYFDETKNFIRNNTYILDGELDFDFDLSYEIKNELIHIKLY